MRKSLGAWIPAHILYDKELNSRQQILYAILSNLADDEGQCFPSNEYLGEQLNCTTDTISRNIHVLRDKKYISYWMEKTVTGTRRIIQIGGGVGENAERGVGENAESIYNGNEDKDDKSSKPDGDPSGKEERDKIIANNKHLLRHMPKTVDRKAVTAKELNWVIYAMDWFNFVRAVKLGFQDNEDDKYRNLTPDAKACRQLIDLHRTMPDIGDTWLPTIENMFKAQNHIDSKFKYLTPEFCSRKSKIDIYYAEIVPENE